MAVAMPLPVQVKPPAPAQPDSPLRHRKFTRDELMWMSDAGFFIDQRIERIDGEILDLGNMGPKHAAGIEIANETIRKAFTSGYRIRVQLPLSPDVDNDPVPDISVLPGTARDFLASLPSTASLVIEVSDTTLRFDRIQKASLYARSGVQDYWILDVNHNRLEVRRDPIPMPEEPFGWGYGSLQVLDPEDEIAPLAEPNSIIKVADLLP